MKSKIPKKRLTNASLTTIHICTTLHMFNVELMNEYA